jgi:hypothetical protein
MGRAHRGLGDFQVLLGRGGATKAKDEENTGKQQQRIFIVGEAGYW